MPYPKKNPETKVTLEALLELKRHERPSADFWDSFDRELKRKTLQKLAHQPTVGDRIWGLVKKAGVVFAPAGALAAAVLAIYVAGPSVSVTDTNTLGTDYTAKSESGAMPAGADFRATVRTSDLVETPVVAIADVRAQFVVDAFEANDSQAHFRKVRALESFQPTGSNSARYVADHLIGGATAGANVSATLTHF